MNYTELFNLLYSTRISESLKDTIINKLEYTPITEEVNECSSEVEACIQLIDTLAESSISEEVMFSVLDETFSFMNEEFIDEVFGEYIKRKADEYMKKRAYNKAASNVIGLGDTFKKAEEAGDAYDKAKEATKAAKVSSNPKSNGGALDKLKNAADKVKNFYDTFNRKPVSHADISAAIGREAIKNEKEGKPNFSNLTTVSGSNVSSTGSGKKSTSKGMHSSSVNVFKNLPVAVKSGTSVSSKNTEQKTEKDTSGERVLLGTSKSEPLLLSTTKGRRGRPRKVFNNSSNSTEQNNSRTEKINKIKEKAKGHKLPSNDSVISLGTTKSRKDTKVNNNGEAKPERTIDYERLAQYSNSRTNDKKRLLDVKKSRLSSMTSKPGFNEKEAEKLRNEIANLESSIKESALVDIVSLLGNTNISESSFIEIMELFAPNKKNADKVKTRHEEDFNKAIDDLNKEVVNNDVKPETVNKVNSEGEKKEKFDEIYRKRFGSN